MARRPAAAGAAMVLCAPLPRPSGKRSRAALTVHPATVELPAGMTLNRQYSHEAFNLFQAPDSTGLSFVHTAGQGGWGTYIPPERLLREEPPCRLSAGAAIRGTRSYIIKRYVALGHEGATAPRLYVAVGQVMFRDSVGVQWLASARSREKLERLLGAVSTLREASGAHR